MTSLSSGQRRGQASVPGRAERVPVDRRGVLRTPHPEPDCIACHDAACHD